MSTLVERLRGNAALVSKRTHMITSPEIFLDAAQRIEDLEGELMESHNMLRAEKLRNSLASLRSK